MMKILVALLLGCVLMAPNVFAEYYAYVLTPIIGDGTKGNEYRPAVNDLIDPGAPGVEMEDDELGTITVYPGYAVTMVVDSNLETGAPVTDWAVVLVRGHDLSAIEDHADMEIIVESKNKDKLDKLRSDLKTKKIKTLTKTKKDKLLEKVVEGIDDETDMYDTIEAVGKKSSASFKVEKLRLK